MSIENSKAYRYVLSKGWAYRVTSTDQINLESCPVCANSNYKFFMSAEPEKDGLWLCHVCSESGNLYDLREFLGDSHAGSDFKTTSLQEAARSLHQVEALPDFEAAHRRLVQQAEDPTIVETAMDYLIGTRGFSMEVIERMKLGLDKCYSEKNGGEVPALLIPYFDKSGKAVFCKWRILPPGIKDFKGSVGRESRLYNEAAIPTSGASELICMEGEPDTLSMLSNGFENVVGVPGANNKRTTWLALLDHSSVTKYLICYDNDEVGQAGAKALATKIGLQKCWNVQIPAEVNGTVVKDAGEFFLAGGTREHFLELMEQATQFHVDGIANVSDVLEKIKKRVESGDTLQPPYKTQFEGLNSIIKGWDVGQVIGIHADAKQGKALSLSASLKTPAGWLQMGDVKVGDELASVDGLASFVTGVYPQGELEMFRVTFSDGRSVVASGDHLWTLTRVSNPRYGSKEWTTEQVRLAMQKDPKLKLCVPLCSGDFGCSKALPLDPYVLGVLLGDGSITSSTPRVEKVYPDLVREVKERLSRHECTVGAINSKYFRLVKKQGLRGPNPVSEILKSLSLHGCDSFTKFIPTQYLMADKESRIDLLAGLMDTDGTTEQAGTTYYSTSSKRLALGVQELVRSLGGISDIREKIPFYGYKGQRLQGALSYIVTVKVVNRQSLFLGASSKRARAAGVGDDKQNRLSIVSISSVGKHQAQCIAVDHPSALYITDDYIVTHNTTLAMNFLDHLVRTYSEPGLFLCEEMTTEELVTKWISMATDTDDASITVDTVSTAMAMAASYPADLLFGFTAQRKYAQIAETIRQAVRRYGVKFVVFDNLQLLETGSKDSWSQVIAQNANAFVSLCMELGIVLLLIIQPHSVKPGEIVTSDHAHGSSQIKKAVHMMINLNRERTMPDPDSIGMSKVGYVHDEGAFAPEAMLYVDRSRSSPGGYCTLFFDGAKSKFYEHDPRPSVVKVIEATTVNWEEGEFAAA